MSLESLKVQIIRKAWEDPAFKKALLSNPKETLRDAFGIDLPADIELVAVAETPNRYYLVIPPNPEDLPDDPSPPTVVW